MSDSNYPFYDVVEQANQLIQKGAIVYQKFTCDECGVRQTMDVPNTFYKFGRCEECGGSTNIETEGCNFLLVQELK